MLKFLKDPKFAYVAFFLGAVFYGLGQVGIIDPTMAVAISGFFGFGGVTSLRSFIDSKGIKSYVIAIIGIVVALGLGFGVIPLDLADKILGVLGGLVGVTVTHGVVKSQG